MNRKTIIIVFALLLAVLAGAVLLWNSSPEYGDSYSEQQRKLWNERRALYPMTWVFEQINPENTNFLTRIEPLTEGSLIDLLERKRARDQELMEEQEKLQKKEKPVVSYTFEKTPDYSSQRPFEVSMPECLRRAKAGDADACLVMAWHLGWRKEASNRLSLLGWREKRDVLEWLSRAESLKRPGCLFLKNFCQMIQKESAPLIQKHSLTGLGWSTVPCPDYRNLPGYDEFLACMQRGDALPYRVMRDMVLCHTLPDREVKILREVLRERVKTGDLQAMEDMAALAFDIDDNDWTWKNADELEKSVWNQYLMDSLPEKWQEEAYRVLLRLGVLDPERTETMEIFREGADCALRSAQSGSLAGMYYWLRYGLGSLHQYSREDWDEVFLFHRNLLEQGYIPFVSKGDGLGSYIVNYFYGDGMWKHLYMLDQELRKRGVIPQGGGDLLAPETTNAARQLLEQIEPCYGVDDIVRGILSQHYMNRGRIHAEAVAVYVGKIQSIADEGDPLGLYALGAIIEEGVWLPCDLKKAWSCYAEAIKLVESKDLTYSGYRDHWDNRCPYSSHIRLPEAVKMSMISLAIRYPELAEHDREQIFKMACELEPQCSDDGPLGYLLGRVYEDGIGTKPDQKKAMEFYSKNRKYGPSAERWYKLQSEPAPPDQKEEK